MIIIVTFTPRPETIMPLSPSGQLEKVGKLENARLLTSSSISVGGSFFPPPQNSLVYSVQIYVYITSFFNTYLCKFASYLI
jgi:hypothetical protein